MGAGRGKNRLSALISWALKSYLTSLSLTFFCQKGVVTVLTWQGHCVTHVRSNGSRAHTLWPSWLPWGLEQLQKPECLGAEACDRTGCLGHLGFAGWDLSSGLCRALSGEVGEGARNSAGCSPPARLPTPHSELPTPHASREACSCPAPPPSCPRVWEGLGHCHVLTASPRGLGTTVGETLAEAGSRESYPFQGPRSPRVCLLC